MFIVANKALQFFQGVGKNMLKCMFQYYFDV